MFKYLIVADMLAQRSITPGESYDTVKNLRVDATKAKIVFKCSRWWLGPVSPISSDWWSRLYWLGSFVVSAYSLGSRWAYCNAVYKWYDQQNRLQYFPNQGHGTQFD